jgi:hypothetical protein
MDLPAWERLPMERIGYEGGTGDRFVLLAVTKRYGGDPVAPLYEQQARRLMKAQREAGFLTRLIRVRPNGSEVVESDF